MHAALAARICGELTMWRDAWFIGRKDVLHTLRDKETIIWVFIMPIVFFYFIGTVTSNTGSGQGGRATKIAVDVPASGGFLAEEIVRRLQENNYEVIRSQDGELFEGLSRRLTIPENFTEGVLSGEGMSVLFDPGTSGNARQFEQFRTGRATYTVLADILASVALGQQPSTESFQALQEMPRALTLTVKPAGQRKVIPSGYEQAIPGITVMFTLLALLTGGAVLLVIERRQGLLRRMASTPMRRGAIVLGKWTGKMIYGIIQLAFAMLTGTLVFGMNWGPAWPMVLVVVLAWAAACASFGLMLGNFARTEGQAIALGVLSANVLAALGGCWWPIEITPGWMQSLQKCLPTGWAMDAVHRLITFQHAPNSVLPHVLALSAAALLCGWITARRFRFQ